MNGWGSPLLSVRAEARQLVAPDYAVLDGLIEHTAGSKVEAVRSVVAVALAVRRDRDRDTPRATILPVMRRARHSRCGLQPQAAVTRLLTGGGGESAAAIQPGTAGCTG
jgi:hypothetical protein